MDLTTIRTTVRDLFGDVDGIQSTDATLLIYINYALDEISRRLHNVRAAATFAACDGLNTEGVGGVAVPTDFLREIDVRWNGVKLSRARFDEIYLPGDQLVLGSGDPSFYSVTPVDKTFGQRRIIFYPYQTLTKAATIYLLYIGRSAPLVNGGDVPKIPDDLHMALVFYTAFLMAAQEGDSERATFFKSQFTELINNWSVFMVEAGYNENAQVKEDAEALYYIDY